MDNSTTQPETTATINRSDLYQQVTDSIIRQLETGTVPWYKPWYEDGSLSSAIPKNSVTKNAYQGINILLLWSFCEKQHFVSNEWASFKQWQSQKEYIRKGEKGSMIVYYDTFEKEVDGEIKKIPFLKYSLVYNRCQLASFDPKKKTENTVVYSLVEKIDRADLFIQNTAATIAHIGSEACYLPQDDVIYMPDPETFLTTPSGTATEGYYATLSHELVHWTGHTTRLNREHLGRFGTEAYAREELVGELGAAFLCAELEITTVPQTNHAAYMAGWLKALKNDKTIIFKAASEASKAVGYLKGLQPKE